MRARAPLHAFGRLARTLGVLAARGPMRRAAALYLGLAIVASVLFAPNALRASDVVMAADLFPPARAILLAIWLVLTGAIARELVEAPGATILRALPLPRWWFWVVQGAHLLVAEVPWIVLWTAGGGPLVGAAAAALAVAAHALLVLRPRTWLDRTVAAVVLLSALLPLPPAALLALSLAAGAWALPQAWRRSWEHRRHRWNRRVAGPAVLALSLAYIARLRRSEPGLLLKSFALIVVGSAVVVLAVVNNEITALATLFKVTLAIATPLLLIASGSIGAAILRAESADRWLMDALACPAPCGAWPPSR